METTTDHRAEMIRGLRAMADWLEAHPGIPVSRYNPVTMTLFPADEAEARAIRAAAPGGWGKDPAGDFIAYERQFSGAGSGTSRVQYRVLLSKNQTCERVQVGTRHVAAHDEPVYEWRCAPAEDAPAIDSEAWTCASCKGPFIGGRPGDDLCRECTGRMLAASIRTGTPLPVEDDDMGGERHPEDPEPDPASPVGTIVARIIDDSPGPLTGRVVGQVDEDRVEVLWGDAQYSQHGDAWRPDAEYIDELRPVAS